MDPADIPGNKAPSRKYANDPEDNEFIDTLIRAVEQSIVYAQMQEQERATWNDLLAAQLALDDCVSDMAFYEDLEEPALDALVELTEKRWDRKRETHKRCEQAYSRATACVRTSSTKRNRLVSSLYADENANRFITRDVTGNVQCDVLEFTREFHVELARLVRSDERLQDSKKNMRSARKNLIATPRGSRIHGVDDAQRKTHNHLLARLKTEEATFARQQEYHTRQEQTFFQNTAHDILVAGEVLPPLASLDRSPTPDDLERVGSRPKEQQSENVASAHAPAEPQRQRLHAARSLAAKANATLDRIRRMYARDLANFLITYKGINKENFDLNYQQKHDETPYEAVEAEAAEAVQRAEADYDLAWHEAVAAGVTDLPLSPKGLGDRSEDGYVESCNSKEDRRITRTQEKQRPRIERWGKGVARGGSPGNPERASPRASAEQANLAPGGSREPTPEAGFATTSRNRVERYARHQERTMKRAAEQDAELLRAAAEPKASATKKPRTKKWCCCNIL